ncbi:MAG: M48 family metallopeptidase [Candidatus Diapherotrites archaeon]|nr:M48 family metallopeptidase [Candidatus Diapherotrites archaeon]
MEKISFHDQISANKLKSLVLAGIIFGVILVVGWFLSYAMGGGLLFYAFIAIFSLGYTFVTYQYSDKIALIGTGARPANKAEHARVINLIEGLSIGAGMPMPKIYIIDNPDINAFAAGKDPEHAIVGITTGALQQLNKDELEGVLAHEMSHVMNYDIRFATIVAAMVGLIAIVSDMLLRTFFWGGFRSNDNKGGGAVTIVMVIVLTIIARVFVEIVRLAFSRQREFLADASGAKLTRYPEGLAGALEKIGKVNKSRMKVSGAAAHMFFANPFDKVWFASLFSTHPDVKERVKRLRSM